MFALSFIALMSITKLSECLKGSEINVCFWDRLNIRSSNRSGELGVSLSLANEEVQLTVESDSRSIPLGPIRRCAERQAARPSRYYRLMLLARIQE